MSLGSTFISSEIKTVAQCYTTDATCLVAPGTLAKAEMKSVEAGDKNTT